MEASPAAIMKMDGEKCPAARWKMVVRDGEHKQESREEERSHELGKRTMQKRSREKKQGKR